MTPTLHTNRLTLRAFAEADWPAYCSFLTGPRGAFFGAPKTEAKARETFEAQRAADAQVFELKKDPRALGSVGIGQPEGIDAPELAWSIWRDEDEGKGYAFEAAQAVRVDYFNKHPEAALVSYIDPSNTRSVALAKRLGCALDPEAKAPFEAGVTYRHPTPDMAGGDGGMEAYA